MREFVELAFKHIDVEIVWQGTGVDEIGKDKKTGVTRVIIDPKYYRPAEVETLLGDASKAKKLLGWEPKTTFQDLLKEMMENDINTASKEKHILDGGFKL